MASQITGATVVFSTVCSDADQRKHQSSAVTGEYLAQRASNVQMFSFDGVLMWNNAAVWIAFLHYLSCLLCACKDIRSNQSGFNDPSEPGIIQRSPSQDGVAPQQKSIK